MPFALLLQAPKTGTEPTPQAPGFATYVLIVALIIVVGGGLAVAVYLIIKTLCGRPKDYAPSCRTQSQAPERQPPTERPGQR